MMNLEQLQAMSDEQLDEAVALAQGWVKHRNHWFDYKEPPTVSKPVCLEEDYRPTADTVEGKAQSFDLMVKFGIVLDKLESHSGYIAMWASKDKIDIKRVKNKNPQHAITIASIVSAQEDNNG